MGLRAESARVASGVGRVLARSDVKRKARDRSNYYSRRSSRSLPSSSSMAVRHFALVPAAGVGQRFGAEVPKQYLELAGRPLLAHAVRALTAEPRIELVFVVLAPRDVHYAALDWNDCGDRVAPLYCGGRTRAESVRNGLVAASGTVDFEDWVLVHDAARPCVPRSDVARLIDELADDPVGGLLAVPVADTLKRADDAGRVVATESRTLLWQAQTPQMFRAGTLLAAFDAMRKRDPQLATVTDEAFAVERLGLAPRLVQGSAANLKVTYPADVGVARRWLETTRDAPRA